MYEMGTNEYRIGYYTICKGCQKAIYIYIYIDDEENDRWWINVNYRL